MSITPLSFLTEQEKDALEMFIQNPYMREAVRKYLLDDVSGMGVQSAGDPSLMNRNWVFGFDPTGTLNDNEYGRAIRTHVEAIVLVEKAFEKMKEVIPPTPEQEEKPKHL